MSSPQEINSGHFGGYVVTGTTAIEQRFNSIQMNGDTVIAELYHADEPSINVAVATYTSTGGDTERGYNAAGNSIASGLILISQAGKDFSKIKLTSGSVIIH